MDKKSTTIGTVHINATAERLTEEQVIRMSIEEMKARLEALQITRVNREASEKIFALYQSHMDAGFSSKQAWELLLGSLRSAGMLR